MKTKVITPCVFSLICFIPEEGVFSQTATTNLTFTNSAPLIATNQSQQTVTNRQVWQLDSNQEVKRQHDMEAISDMDAEMDGTGNTILDPETGQYAFVDPDGQTVVSKDRQGHVLWSVNVSQSPVGLVERGGEIFGMFLTHDQLEVDMENNCGGVFVDIHTGKVTPGPRFPNQIFWKFSTKEEKWQFYTNQIRWNQDIKEAMSNYEADLRGEHDKAVDPKTGRYAYVNPDRQTVTVKDKAGHVLWSTNIFQGLSALNPDGGKRIQSIRYFNNNSIEVMLGGNVASLIIDITTGKVAGGAVYVLP